MATCTFLAIAWITRSKYRMYYHSKHTWTTCWSTYIIPERFIIFDVTYLIVHVRINRLVLNSSLLQILQHCTQQVCTVFLLSVLNISVLHLQDSARISSQLRELQRWLRAPRVPWGAACLRGGSRKSALIICSPWKQFVFLYLLAASDSPH